MGWISAVVWDSEWLENIGMSKKILGNWLPANLSWQQIGSLHGKRENNLIMLHVYRTSMTNQKTEAIRYRDYINWYIWLTLERWVRKQKFLINKREYN